MVIIGEKFIYRNISSDSLNLIMCSFESGTTDDILISKSVVSKEITYNRPRINITASKHTEPLKFQIALAHENGDFLTTSEVGLIVQWMCGDDTPSQLSVYDSESVYVEYEGLFSEITAKKVGECVAGIIATFTCNTPYGVLNKRRSNIEISSGNSTITFPSINELSSTLYFENRYYYPKFSIIVPANVGGDINITNTTSSNSMGYSGDNTVFSIPVEGDASVKKFTVDCLNKIVSRTTYSDAAATMQNSFKVLTVSDLGWSADAESRIYWFRLVPGENSITIGGSAGASCRLTIEYQIPVVSPVIPGGDLL